MNDMYETFSGCDIPYGDYGVNNCFPKYDNNIRAIWNQDDSICLSFKLWELPNYEQLPTLENKMIHFTFYNFRMEKVYECDEDAQPEVILQIPLYISHDIFVRGFYYCSLELQEFDGEDSEKQLVDNITILNRVDCAFYVR